MQLVSWVDDALCDLRFVGLTWSITPCWYPTSGVVMKRVLAAACTDCFLEVYFNVPPLIVFAPAQDNVFNLAS